MRNLKKLVRRFAPLMTITILAAGCSTARTARPFPSETMRITSLSAGDSLGQQVFATGRAETPRREAQVDTREAN